MKVNQQDSVSQENKILINNMYIKKYLVWNCIFLQYVFTQRTLLQYKARMADSGTELQRRSSKILEDTLEPVSIVHYTRPGSSIKQPNQN